jgi:hypothetical protein
MPDYSKLINSADIANWTANTTMGNFYSGMFETKTDQFNADPLIPGYSFILWTKIPVWVEKEFEKREINVKDFTQKNFKAFNGISDIELASSAIQQGFTNNEVQYPTGITKQNDDFSITHQEFSGSPVRQIYSLWVSGIRDPRTGIAMYPKWSGLPYKQANHTGELLYVVMRPDVATGGKAIEFAAYYTAVYPIRIPLAHLNHEQGSHDPMTIEINFKGDFHWGPKVETFAAKKVEELFAFETMANFDPEAVFEGKTLAETV